MANFTSHIAGTFCWPELCTHNWQQGKKFYCELFGWGSDDQPIGPDTYYTMLQKEGLDIAAMYQMENDRIELEVPSHWLNYIAVDDVEAKVLKAQKLGAELLHGPHTVGDAGKMALLVEPEGAVFALWQGMLHPGSRKLKEPNTMCWNELASRNSANSQAFYCQLFDWQVEAVDMEGMAYIFYKQGNEKVAGMLEMNEQWSEIPPHWMTYFAVENCDEIAAQAQALGAVICVPPTDFKDVGRFSVLTDPQGADFSIIELMAK
ncbi:VOC family protein [Pseudoalteromonas tunicata]|uniref:VOC family protein n=1 Tax=Pseudoalteromonas tunicata TaxID=314281 RepID=UPI002740222C|nr:VOC family protein [Pseudoalteromonas tunicata]MDP5214637.1 VOC family protein [Pseudoalteromonas tunicata]